MNSLSLLYNHTRKYHFLLLLLIMVLINAGLFRFLALPYRFVPSDDLVYWRGLQSNTVTVLQALSQLQNPAFWLYLLGCSQLWSLCSPVSENAFPFSCLLANTLATVSIMLASRRLTGKSGWSVAAGLLYLTSAWTNNYYFFFSYAPLPAALLITAFALSLQAAYQEPSATGPARLWSAMGGIVLGLAFWVAPAATLPIALLLPLIVLLHRRAWIRRGLSLLGWQAAGFGLAFMPFAVLCWQAYIRHIIGNILTYHYEEAYAKFSYVPTPPSFSFIRMLSAYSPLQSGLVLLVALLLGLALLKLQRGNDPQAAAHPAWLQPPFRLCLLLIAICLLHALAIDLLPTTKLARAHFQILPLLFVWLVAVPPCLLTMVSSISGRKIITTGYGATLALAALLSALKSLETRAVRTAVPDYLAKITSLQHIYLLKEDPHADYIAQWLRDERIRPIAASTITQVMQQESGKGGRSILLIGPTGPKSGNSILEHSVMADFNLTLPASITERLIFLPYYSYYPPFLFEEEISQALYFAAEVPDDRARDSLIKVLSW